MNILELADILEASIEIFYYPNQDGRFCASFRGCEIKGDGVLCSGHGNGKTPFEAINNYANEIVGKVLIFNASSKEFRREFKCPNTLQNL